MDQHLKSLCDGLCSGRVSLGSVGDFIAARDYREDLLGQLRGSKELLDYLEAILLSSEPAAEVWEALSDIAVYGLDSPGLRLGVRRQADDLKRDTARWVLSAAAEIGEPELISICRAAAMREILSGRAAEFEDEFFEVFHAGLSQEETDRLEKVLDGWKAFRFSFAADTNRQWKTAEKLEQGMKAACRALGLDPNALPSITQKWMGEYRQVASS